MARVKRGVTSHAKHKKVLEQAKGYYGRRKNTIRIARQAVEKANQYAYRDRRNRKRNFRALWIQRINAAARAEGLTYGRLFGARATGEGGAGLSADADAERIRGRGALTGRRSRLDPPRELPRRFGA